MVSGRGFMFCELQRNNNFLLGAGLGACGTTYSKNDFIVALAQITFGWSYPSPYCNRPIVISYGGKIAHAIITDSVRREFLRCISPPNAF